MSGLETLDRETRDWMESWHCPGAAVAIVQGDKLLHRGVYGLRDVENKLPMTVDTRFALASVTKSFTAMSVALLVDKGKLEWDKPVREYLPEFVLDDSYVTQHMTLRDMLAHRTGLPRHDYSAWRLELPRFEFIKRMRHLKFSASLRERFQYNNLMYYVTPCLVEKVTGQRWEDFVRERIFTPLGMKASNLRPEPPRKDQVNAVGYRVDRDEKGEAKGLIPVPDRPCTELSPGAAGGLYSTLADLSKWIQVHVNNGKSGNFQVVSPDVLQQMHRPQMVVSGGGFAEALHENTIFTYGLGWFIEPYRGHTLVHHSGNLEGFSLAVGLVPLENVGVAVLTNLTSTPLRDVLLREGIDRALDLPDRSWNAKYHQFFDSAIAGEARSKTTSMEERRPDAPPTHPLDTYVGSFETKGYPDFAVRRNGEGLQARIGDTGDWMELRHYHYNVFEWRMLDWDLWIKTSFLVNENGDPDSVSIPLEPEVDNIVFSRKQPDLPPKLIRELVGEYELQLEGENITITHQEGKFHATFTGVVPREIKLYKLNDDCAGFRMGRSRLDFVRKGKGFTSIILKGPYITLEAPRKQTEVGDDMESGP